LISAFAGVRKAYAASLIALEQLAAALILSIAVLVAADIGLRAAGWSPLVWTSALTEFGVAYATMAVAPRLAGTSGHIVIETATGFMPLRARRFADITALSVASLIAGAMALLSLHALADSVAHDELDVRSVTLPKWAYHLPIAMGFGLMAIEYLSQAMVRFRAKDST
jgi:TRAP-type C4-dicarboxylate transport system permease small subunit